MEFSSVGRGAVAAVSPIEPFPDCAGIFASALFGWPIGRLAAGAPSSARGAAESLGTSGLLWKGGNDSGARSLAGGVEAVDPNGGGEVVVLEPKIGGADGPLAGSGLFTGGADQGAGCEGAVSVVVGAIGRSTVGAAGGDEPQHGNAPSGRPCSHGASRVR